jgi:hypothetical protein
VKETMLDPTDSVAYRRGQIMAHYIAYRVDDGGALAFRPLGINPYPLWSCDYEDWNRGYEEEAFLLASDQIENIRP